MSTFNSANSDLTADIDFSKVICVTNRGLFKSQSDFLRRLEKIAAAGPKAIVLREKDMEPADYEA